MHLQVGRLLFFPENEDKNVPLFTRAFSQSKKGLYTVCQQNCPQVVDHDPGRVKKLLFMNKLPWCFIDLPSQTMLSHKYPCCREDDGFMSECFWRARSRAQIVLLSPGFVWRCLFRHSRTGLIARAAYPSPRRFAPLWGSVRLWGLFSFAHTATPASKGSNGTAWRKSAAALSTLICSRMSRTILRQRFSATAFTCNSTGRGA